MRECEERVFVDRFPKRIGGLLELLTREEFLSGAVELQRFPPRLFGDDLRAQRNDGGQERGEE